MAALFLAALTGRFAERVTRRVLRPLTAPERRLERVPDLLTGRLLARFPEPFFTFAGRDRPVRRTLERAEGRRTVRERDVVDDASRLRWTNVKRTWSPSV